MKRKLHTQVSGSVLMENNDYGELAYRLTQLIGMQLLNAIRRNILTNRFGKKLLHAAVGLI